jgi:hypothetical protein
MAIQHYSGGCQCGAVRFEVDVDLDKTITCNCSRCQRLGSVLSFTSRDRLRLLSGEENLTEYLFNKHKIHHLFCKTCGIQGFSYALSPDGTPGAAINVNCLDGVEPRQLNSQHFNGRDA